MTAPSAWTIDRRTLLKGLAALPLAGLAGRGAAAETDHLRTIPSSGEKVPPVGLGSWITFNVGRDPAGLARSEAVIHAFLAAGGRLIDSSPMYGSAQATIGHALARIGETDGLFAADKVWTSGRSSARAQLAETQQAWGLERFALLQVHNLEDWEGHLPWLREMKAAGMVRHVGVTTSHGRRHGELERILARESLDFVQLTYNAASREAEARLLPLARERGVAVIANRPYEGGRLIRRLQRDPLPDWARAAGFRNWPDVALGFIIGHPALTVAIPATSQVAHVEENVAAGRLPPMDEAVRRRIAAYVDDL